MAVSQKLTEDPLAADMKDSTGVKIMLTDLSKFKDLNPTDLDRLAKEVTDEQIKHIVDKVESMQDSDFTSMVFSIFDFIGFDPQMVSRVLKAYQDHYNDGDDTLLSDIKFSIAACLYMGNLQLKSMTKRSLEGRTKIEYLAQKYGIRTGTQNTGLPATALTFPRIAAAYPVLAIRMAVKCPPKTVNLDFKSLWAPAYMRLTPFASLCAPTMDQELRIFLQEACNAHGSDMAIAFEKGKRKKTNPDFKPDAIAIANDQWAFIEVASASPVPTEDAKKALLTQLNLTKDYENIAKLVANYRAIMTKVGLDKVTVLGKKEFEDRLSKYISSS